MTIGEGRARIGTRSRLLLGLLTLLAVGTAPALAQQETRGVEITPSRVEQDLPGSDFDYSILLVNHEDSAQQVTLSVSGLGHDLDGTPMLLEPADVTRSVQLGETEFVLQPSRRREVAVEGTIPGPDPSAYFAVIAEFSPLGVQEGQIESRSRVASLFLLRAPPPWEQTLRVVDVSVGEGPLGAAKKNKKRPLLPVYAAVKNTGNAHVKPRAARMRITKDGRVLDVVDLEPQNIIPGFARRLLGEWRAPRNLTGRVDLRVNVFDPDAQGSGFVEFTDGEVRRPGASIANLVARNEDGAIIEFVLTNTGTISLAPDVHITATRETELSAERSFVQSEMEPGDQEIIRWRPELERGIYLIEVQVSLEEQVLATASTGLQIEDAGIVPWIVIGGGILLLLLLALLIFFLRRRRRDDSEPDPESGAAAA